MSTTEKGKDLGDKDQDRAPKVDSTEKKEKPPEKKDKPLESDSEEASIKQKRKQTRTRTFKRSARKTAVKNEQSKSEDDEDEDEDEDDDEDDDVTSDGDDVSESENSKKRCTIRQSTVDAWIDKLVEFEETQLAPSVTNMSIADALYGLEASRDMPAVRLNSFDGNPLKYVDFIDSFHTHIHNKPNLSDDMRMMQLKMHLSGNAERSVSGLGSAGIMYATALKTVKTEFGQPSFIARAFIAKLTKGDKIKPFDRHGLKAFSIDIVNCMATLKRLNYMADVNATETLRQIVRRLPDALIVKWKSVSVSIRDRAEIPTLEHIRQFVQSVVRAEFDPDFGDVDRSRYEVRESVSRYSADAARKRGIHSVQSRPKSAYCYVCKGLHRVIDCPVFRESSVQNRVEIARVNRLCYSCLVRGHTSRECRSKRHCGRNGCTRTHHPMLHVDLLCASGSLPSSDKEVLMPVVRVRFRAPNGHEREGNVLIDSGAGATIIRKDFAKSLGLQGRKEGLEISVVGGDSIKQPDSRRVKFFISSIAGGEEFEVEAREIEKTVISVPSLNRKWITSFDHLKDVTLTQKSGPVDLILGVHYSHLHAEQEVREGLPFQPVGKRTRLGWIVIGSDNHQRKLIPSVNAFDKIDIDKMYSMETLGVLQVTVHVLRLP